MSRKLFIISSYFNQEKKISLTGVFNSYIDARRYIRNVSINRAKVYKKYPVCLKRTVKRIIEKEITGETALPIIDFKWIGEKHVIRTYRISILFLK